MRRLIWTGNPHAGNGTYVVKLMGIDHDCGEACVDFGVGDFEWIPLAELLDFDSSRPIADVIAEESLSV